MNNGKRVKKGNGGGKGFDSRQLHKLSPENQSFQGLIKKTRPKTRPKSELLYEFLKLKTHKMLASYKPAKLYDKTAEWYIYYSFRNPATGVMKRFKERFDINRIHILAEKKQYGLDCCRFLNEKLANGFNPFEFTGQNMQESSGNIIDQTDSILKLLIKNATKNQAKTYFCMMNRLVRFIEINKLQDINMMQIDDKMACNFQQYLIDQKLAVKTINATISHIALFWECCIKEKYCYTNPFKLLKPVRRSAGVSNEDIFEPITFDELSEIREYLNNNNLHNFWRFLCMIYCTWARPVEICKIRVADIILQEGDDHIRFKKGQTKNDKGGFVQILPQLKKLLIEMRLENCPGDWYVFGANDYMPGPVKMIPGNPTEHWRKNIIKKLNIKKKMYALKHTGNIEYLQRNKGTIDLKWQQRQNRHSNADMTERYNRKLGAYFIDTSNIKFMDL